MKLNTILLAGAAMIAATGAQAQTAKFALSETFDNGYSYDDGSSVPVTLTGTFTGTRNGNVITNLSNINLFFNGVAFNGNGNLYTAQFDPNRGFVNSGGGQLSLDNSANNALIIDSDYANGASGYTNFFFSIPQNSDETYNGIVVGYNNFTGGLNSHLVITQVGATGAVPEPATWAMMLLGFGMIGFGLRYRRNSTAVRFA